MNTSETIPVNYEGQAVDLSEGIYFVQHEVNGNIVFLSLKKESALLNSTYEELLGLNKLLKIS